MGYTSLYDIDYTICDKWTNDRILSHLFFWWNEFIRLVVDKLWYKKKMSVVNEAGHLTDFSTSLFLMGIYWVFIVVFFGFMAGSKNAEIMKVNMMVLFFHNWFLT